MASTSRELLLGVALALWFPVSLAVTDAASSEPGEVGTPASPSPTASR